MILEDECALSCQIFLDCVITARMAYLWGSLVSIFVESRIG